jgi:hypothetical protein
MIRSNSNRSDATKQPGSADNPDACLIDDEFDDMLDREFFAIREIAGFCNC